MRAGIFRRCGIGVAVLLLALPLAACATGATTSAATGPTPTSAAAGPTSTPADPLPVARDIAAAGATRIEATPNPEWAVAAAGSVWIAGVGKGVRRYDAATGAAGSEVAVYSVCSLMDYGFESVWAVSCDLTSPALVRIDARTGAAVATIPLPGRLPADSSIGAGEGGVWLLTSGRPPQLVMVDPTTNTVTRSFPAPPGAIAVRTGFGSVWVSVATPGQLIRLDPTSGQVVATVPVGRGASLLAAGPDAMWVINASDGSVSRVDATTNAVTATIKVAAKGIDGDIAVAADAVWVRVEDDDAMAVRIDPRANTVDRYGPGSGSGGIAIADDSVWITAAKTFSIWRLPR
jgi:YVTN family beta-propeller protein